MIGRVVRGCNFAARSAGRRLSRWSRLRSLRRAVCRRIRAESSLRCLLECFNRGCNPAELRPVRSGVGCYPGRGCDPSDFGLQIAHGLPALVAVLDETALQCAIERWGDVRNRRRRTLHDRSDHARGRCTLKGALAGDHFVQHQAEGKNIAARVDLLTRSLRLQLFRRHVIKGADDFVPACERHGERGRP